MLRTTHILMLTTVLGVTILGLTAILHGGFVDIQLSPGTTIKVIGPETKVTQ